MVVIDTHHHLDFLPTDSRAVFLTESAKHGVQVVAQTLLPSAFRELKQWLDSSNIVSPPLISLGFHPWQIESHAQTDAELAIFADAVTTTRFVGEVGLDFTPHRLDTAPVDLQRRVLQQILMLAAEAAASSGTSRVLSLHAVRSAGAVVDLLEECDIVSHGVIPIVHWFSGSSDQLTQLIRAGGYISVNPQMLASKRGRAYVRQVPTDRLVLESDLPGEPITATTKSGAAQLGLEHAHELASQLAQTVATLSHLRGEDMASNIELTQRLF